MENQESVQGAAAVRARALRVQAEMAAARKLLRSGESEIDQVLNVVAERLAQELAKSENPCGDPGVQEERTPAVVRVVVHRRDARV